jgi:predicted porin
MVWGLGLRSRLLIAAGVTLFMGAYPHAPAKAADLGGDCCADLEERVAELEATTARKGNKKVSVEVYGKVNQAVLWWDDGAEKNTYVVENGYNTTRFGFRGKAKITADWSGGYRLEFEHRIAYSRQVSQTDDDNFVDSRLLYTRHSYVYLSNKKLGELRLGLTSSPKDNINKDTMVYGNVIDTVTQDFFMNQGFFLRPKGFNTEVGTQPANGNKVSSLKFIDIARCYSTSSALFDCSTRRNMIVYESAKWFGSKEGQGFFGSWGWGEDDIWSASLRYKDTWGENWSVGGGIAYEDLRDENVQNSGGGLNGFKRDLKEWAGSASILHIPSGLFVTAAFANSDDKDSNRQHGGVFTHTDSPEEVAWDVQAGIFKKFFDLGYSTILVGYTDSKDGIGGACGAHRNCAPGTLPGLAIPTEITGSEVTKWYIALDQEVVPGAMNLYLGYQHITPEVDLVDSALSKVNVPLDDFDLVYSGARIYF